MPIIEEIDTSTKTTLDPFSPDLRPPAIAFGHCGITGHWGKVVTVDLGDMCVKHPGYTKRDPLTGNDVDYPEATITYQNQLTISREGLEALTTFMDNEDMPPISIKPYLVYQWQIIFKDGSAQCQHEIDEKGNEVENRFPLDRSHEIDSICLVDRTGIHKLPTYAISYQTGKFYKNGEEIDTEYEDDLIFEDSNPACFRKNNIDFGSTLQNDGLTRNINGIHTSTLFILGWRCGHPVNGTDKASNLIAVTSEGDWRIWDQVTRLEQELGEQGK